MDIKQIKTLLEKYYEGQTTLQEEQVLIDFYRGEITDPDLLSYRQQFRLLQGEREQIPPVNPDFEVQLANMIDSQGQVPLRINRSRLFFRLAAAAVIAVLIGIPGLLIIQNKWQRNLDTFADPQQAYAEAEKALLYVSQKMNEGIEPLSAVSKINAGSEHLKSLKKLNSGMEMINVVSFINNSSNLKK